MNENVSIMGSIIAVCSAAALCVYFVAGCEKKESASRGLDAVAEKKMMIEAGYEWRLVPGQRDPIWVKP